MLETTYRPPTKADQADPYAAAREDLERLLTRAMGRILTDQERRLMGSLGWPLDLSRAEASEFWNVPARDMEPLAHVLGQYAGQAALIALQGMEGLMVTSAWEDANQRAGEWAAQYSYELIGGINDTTREAVQLAIGAYQVTPGMTRMELEERLAPLFGPMRAESIAVTETTRAVAQGAELGAQVARDAGFRLTPIWHTNRDDLVCPICGPRNERPITDGMLPPAHPRCRCWVTYQLSDEQAEAAAQGQLIPRQSQVPVFETVKQAQAWCEQQFPGTRWDFQGITSRGLPVLQRLVDEYARMAGRFPWVASGVHYLGTYRGPNRVAGHGRFGARTWADAMDLSRLAGRPLYALGIKPGMVNEPQRLMTELQASEQTRWHPAGCSTVESILAHEFGHLVSYYLRSQPSDLAFTDYVTADGTGLVRDTYNMFSGAHPGTSELSTYSRTNRMEMWAEAFSQMMTSPESQWAPQTRDLARFLDKLGDPSAWRTAQWVQDIQGSRAEEIQRLRQLRQDIGLDQAGAQWP